MSIGEVLSNRLFNTRGWQPHFLKKQHSVTVKISNKHYFYLFVIYIFYNFPRFKNVNLKSY